MSNILRKIKDNNLVRPKKLRIFANENDDEPSVLAIDVGKRIPTLKGKDAERFIKKMEEVERKTIST